MSPREEARKTADQKAGAILLEDYTVSVTEEPENWIFVYTPKGRVRGGGFKLTVSKKRSEVSHVLRFQ